MPAPPIIAGLGPTGAARRSAVLGYMAAYALPALAGEPDAAGGAESRIAPPAAGYALTFDDGPHREGTPAVLEILARERVRATFFLVGEQVLRTPRSPLRSSRPVMGSGCTATATATFCA